MCNKVLNLKTLISPFQWGLTHSAVLPSLDIGTDINAFLVYLALNDSDPNHYHPKWAFLTISWVFAPFVIHLGKFFYKLATTRKARWFKLFIAEEPLPHEPHDENI